MNMKYKILFIISAVLISCGKKSKLTELKNDEKLVKSLQNISEIWGSVGYIDKQNLQITLFPEGILYDNEKHDYLTPEINSFVFLTNSISTDCNENKNGIFQNNIEKSHSVVPTGIEPVSKV